ncbi:hypothetical protein CDAR_593271 [Caerostris darwini]|uniref:Uncharacterized protein n=1 Tax=Caerostris darwini TaxID=1538125 RepID=A0AAV4RMD5_9ARAC|nr:hypothetical protein CDAR_593271 [Caerostris darwini]
MCVTVPSVMSGPFFFCCGWGQGRGWWVGLESFVSPKEWDASIWEPNSIKECARMNGLLQSRFHGTLCQSGPIYASRMVIVGRMVGKGCRGNLSSFKEWEDEISER